MRRLLMPTCTTLGLLALTACTAAAPETPAATPTTPPTSAAAAAPLTCAQQPQLGWGELRSEDVLTRAVIMTVGEGSQVTESTTVDVTQVVPGVVGADLAEDLKSYLYAQAGDHTGDIVDSGPTPTDVEGAWQPNLAAPGRYVQYLGVQKLTISVLVACDGRSASAQLTGWRGSRAGILECTVTPSATQVIANEAKKRFCTD